MQQIIITNPTILNYFNEHKAIDPETAFLFFIEILDKFGHSIYDKINPETNKQILMNLNENTKLLNEIKTSYTSINESIINSLIVKMMEIKKDYIEDVKSIISSNTNDKLSVLLEKNNSQMIDKTTLLLSEHIPKNNQLFYTHIDDKIRNFQESIKTETTKILRTVENDKDVKTLINSFDSKFNQMMQNIQQPIHNYISSSEERLNSNITAIREITTQNHVTQDKLNAEICEFLNKYNRTPNYKGQYGEMQLGMLLNQMFPTGEITNTTGQTSCGDFLLKRYNKPTIMFENKDYTENVYIPEVRKFIRDIETINTNGIFLSQRSGIASKANYQIEFHKKNILVYVHNVEYCREKIQIAIDIIDNLSLRIDDLYDAEINDNVITKEALEDIYKEYQSFAIHKDTLIGILKDSNKRSLAQVEELKFPGLEKYLATKYASTINVTTLSNQYRCDICNSYVCSNKKALSAHQRGCKNKN